MPLALVTGASTGIGRATALRLAAGGWTVLAGVREQAAGERLAAEASAPERVIPLTLDVTDAAQRAAAVERVSEQARSNGSSGGGLDALVNNAGTAVGGPLELISEEDLRAQFEVNVFAPLALIQAVLPAMRARRAGRIVNITSVSGVATWAGTGVYCASKWALEGAALSLADEVEPLGIRVSNIEPGGMRTDYAGRSLRQTQRLIDDYAGGPGHQARQILADHAGHEPGDPAKVAAAILRVVDAADPPRQLLLGADAMLYATRHMARAQAEIGQWAEVSLSTKFD